MGGREIEGESAGEEMNRREEREAKNVSTCETVADKVDEKQALGKRGGDKRPRNEGWSRRETTQITPRILPLDQSLTDTSPHSDA